MKTIVCGCFSERANQSNLSPAELKRSAKAVKGRAYVLRISLKRVKLKPKAKGK
jgi:hypothetical protein